MNKEIATLLYFMHNRRYEFIKQYEVLYDLNEILQTNHIYHKSTSYKRTEQSGIDVLKEYFKDVLTGNYSISQKINIIKEQVYNYLLELTPELYAKINIKLFTGSIYYLVTGNYLFETVTKTMLWANNPKNFRKQKKGNFKKGKDKRRCEMGRQWFHKNKSDDESGK